MDQKTWDACKKPTYASPQAMRRRMRYSALANYFADLSRQGQGELEHNTDSLLMAETMFYDRLCLVFCRRWAEACME
jgi:hypothetical protein